MEAAQTAQQAAQTAQQIAQTGQVPRVETPTVPPTAIQPMQTGHVPQIPPLVVPQLAQSSHPIQQPANPLPPSFEPKPITAEISLVADPTTGEVR